MNTTYQRVWTNADLEWKYSKSYYQSYFLVPSATLPGPLLPLYYLAKFLYRTKVCDCKGFLPDERKREKEILEENYRQYKATLGNILTDKNNTDGQNVLEGRKEDNAVLRMEVAELRDLMRTILNAERKKTKYKKLNKRTKQK